MNTVPSNKHADTGNGQASSKKIQESIHPSPYETNITDGGEFLDDAIRMKDQPLMETDFNILKPEN